MTLWIILLLWPTKLWNHQCSVFQLENDRIARLEAQVAQLCSSINNRKHRDRSSRLDNKTPQILFYAGTTAGMAIKPENVSAPAVLRRKICRGQTPTCMSRDDSRCRWQSRLSSYPSSSHLRPFHQYQSISFLLTQCLMCRLFQTPKGL